MTKPRTGSSIHPFWQGSLRRKLIRKGVCGGGGAVVCVCICVCRVKKKPAAQPSQQPAACSPGPHTKEKNGRQRIRRHHQRAPVVWNRPCAARRDRQQPGNRSAESAVPRCQCPSSHRIPAESSIRPGSSADQGQEHPDRDGGPVQREQRGDCERGEAVDLSAAGSGNEVHLSRHGLAGHLQPLCVARLA